jgi:hypothetical protein
VAGGHSSGSIVGTMYGPPVQLTEEPGVGQSSHSPASPPVWMRADQDRRGEDQKTRNATEDRHVCPPWGMLTGGFA